MHALFDILGLDEAIYLHEVALSARICCSESSDNQTAG
jgi:hypothetical protein